MKRRSRAPTKMLVPSLSPDGFCHHTLENDGELTLQVDCGDCSGPQDIRNDKCAAGVLNILAQGVVPETIVLRRFIHVRYRLDRMGWMTEVARCMASLRRISDSEPVVSDARCRTCPASAARVASDLMEKIREAPSAFCAQRGELVNWLGSRRERVDCQHYRSCVREIVSALEHRAAGV